MRNLPPDHTWHRISLEDNGDEARRWCEQQFGESRRIDSKNGTWLCSWGGKVFPTINYFSFKNEQDAVLFAMRWAA